MFITKIAAGARDLPTDLALLLGLLHFLLVGAGAFRGVLLEKAGEMVVLFEAELEGDFFDFLPLGEHLAG